MSAFLDTTATQLKSTWELTSYSAFLVGRESAKYMVKRGAGCILFTGSTASRRAGPNFASYAAGMHGKRAVAQALARELGPKGIHVAHLVIDGVINNEQTREKVGPAKFDPMRDKQGLLEPESIARAFSFLASQTKDAFAFELDLRPYCEPHAF